MRTALYIAGGYLVGGLVTAGWVAAAGPDRVKAGLPVFTGIAGNEGPVAQLLETVALWPFALGHTFVWGKP